MPTTKKVCIIGAGSSGITACQVLNARGIPFDCFEKGSQIGGNWRFENDNGMSSAYRSLHINTSRRVMAFETFPMPDDYPDYPDHFQMAAYFDEYADHFGLREKIRFRTEVLSAQPVDGEWEVTVENAEGGRETMRYRAVLVANGHLWDPRWPEPAFPGAEEFSGEQLHVHHYREPDVLRGKRVLVLGIGNSAADVAVESSRIGDATFLAMRRGAYVLPKYMNGKPLDETSSPLTSMVPLSVQRFVGMRMLGVAAGEMTTYGLPEPDHKLFEAHPTISSELLPRIGHGDIVVKRNIDRFAGGRTVRFVDGSEEEIDLVIYCTGYKMTFPFFEPEVFSAPDNRLPLYRRVVSVERPGLFFIGFIQPLGPVMPLAEAQATWVADLLSGRAALPAAAEMQRDIATEEEKMRKRFVASKRHTIEVDFYPYLREIRRERKLAAKRV
ncbi:MAG TPA: NAD(P)-binding domain-containing protein [Solirubrobacterales bacterium]|jgi:cation diffusion facilitator CzcD-associated flavoprotein CzcO|nr:NAD(P)-binding domain-containing protein [Solirubrobacterales bacterium]